MVALVAYYAAVLVLVGPLCLTQAGAAPTARIPVRISISVAMKTPTTDVATFTTPFPVTVGVAGDGTFTIRRAALAFALVNVPVVAPNFAPGRLVVRAAPTTDFTGTIDTASGLVTLDGSLELLWTKPKPRLPSAAARMVNCPVGPFAIHLSSTTVGGVQLNPVSRSARLVDDDLDVAAVPAGTRQCAGSESGLNGALSLPILPKPKATTTTATDATTVATDPTTAATDPTTTTVADATTAPVDPGLDPGAPGVFAAAAVAPDAVAPPIDPQVLAFEPIPSIVSTLTIASVADEPPTTTTTAGLFVPNPGPTPTTKAPGPTTHHHNRRKAVVATHHAKHRKNKHAQTTAKASTPPPTLPAPRGDPGGLFAPFGSLRHIAPHNPLSSPLLRLGANEISQHRKGLSILFVGLLVLPLISFGLGLVASDFGWRPPFLRRRRRSRARKSPA